MMGKMLKLYGGDVVLHFDPEEHAYTWDGKFIPGVTTILKMLDKPALVQWAANTAVEFILQNWSENLGRESITALCQSAKTAHRKLSKSAAGIGTEVHAFAEKCLTQQRIRLPEEPQARKGAEAILGWVHAHDLRPIAVERMVFSKTHYYAGTTDYYGHINGKLCVADVKTSAGLYLEMLLQLAAYSIAISEETNERIDDGWIIRCDKKTGKFTPYHIPITNGLRDAFLRVREAHQALQRIEPSLQEIKDNATRTPRAA